MYPQCIPWVSAPLPPVWGGFGARGWGGDSGPFLVVDALGGLRSGREVRGVQRGTGGLGRGCLQGRGGFVYMASDERDLLRHGGDGLLHCGHATGQPTHLPECFGCLVAGCLYHDFQFCVGSREGVVRVCCYDCGAVGDVHELVHVCKELLGHGVAPLSDLAPRGGCDVVKGGVVDTANGLIVSLAYGPHGLGVGGGRGVFSPGGGVVREVVHHLLFHLNRGRVFGCIGEPGVRAGCGCHEDSSSIVSIRGVHEEGGGARCVA